jgi:very-short-patch-repair endonuclease
VFDAAEGRVVDEIPVTDPVATLVDLATYLPTKQLEAAVNEADHLDLVNPERLRKALDLLPRRAGAARLRALLDAPTFVLTDSDLERLFLPIAHAAGLSLPRTQVWLNGHRVDFYWPELGLVVEADSLRYHRTPAKQTADNRRDQAHVSAGLTPLRFSHWQVRYEPDHVRRTLATVLRRLTRKPEELVGR